MISTSRLKVSFLRRLGNCGGIFVCAVWLPKYIKGMGRMVVPLVEAVYLGGAIVFCKRLKGARRLVR